MRGVWGAACERRFLGARLVSGGARTNLLRLDEPLLEGLAVDDGVAGMVCLVRVCAACKGWE